jgi:hypothetical protein
VKIGYARVSTSEQRLALQVDTLLQVGCWQVYKEGQRGPRRVAYLAAGAHACACRGYADHLKVGPAGALAQAPDRRLDRSEAPRHWVQESAGRGVKNTGRW